jgi:hypothetical protein
VVPRPRVLLALALVYGLVLGAARVTVAAPERCEDWSAAAARRAALDAAAWIARNQDDDGSFLYQYHRERGVIDDYNAVRHAGSTLSLYDAASFDRQYLGAGDRALEWMLQRLVERDDWAALPDGVGWVPLGGAALMLAALAERRELTEETDYDETMRALGRFVVASQRADGGFYIGYDTAANGFVREGTSRYYPGEAAWALARLENALPGGPWRDAATRAGEFIATRRDDVENVSFPPLNDHWGAYAFAEMADWPVSDAQRAYARLLYGRFALLIRSQAQRDAGGVYAFTHSVRRRGAAVGTWVEGQAALARLARADARLEDRRDDIDRSARCGAAMLVRRQEHEPHDGRVDGAWFAQGETRVDDQQHPISALVGVVEIAAREHGTP